MPVRRVLRDEAYWQSGGPPHSAGELGHRGLLFLGCGLPQPFFSCCHCARKGEKDEAIENLEYEAIEGLERGVRDELQGQHDAAVIDAEVARSLARHKSMWGYVEQALAARITRLTEFLENVGKIDVHPILLALQKSMAEAGTETLRNAARLDEDGEVDMLTRGAACQEKRRQG